MKQKPPLHLHFSLLAEVELERGLRAAKFQDSFRCLTKTVLSFLRFSPVAEELFRDLKETVEDYVELGRDFSSYLAVTFSINKSLIYSFNEL